eukprot:TRINITY_DN14920_c0_g1_i2.p1 TRINITY_DN14920_c0_g1~~TRINITY_DN14920_c0_g1_i2.p1  ORF type:complete len:359 (-),score=54.49 TRINITY_DN14920_c0_g1_i2:814-1890(-)
MGFSSQQECPIKAMTKLLPTCAAWGSGYPAWQLEAAASIGLPLLLASYVTHRKPLAHSGGVTVATTTIGLLGMTGLALWLKNTMSNKELINTVRLLSAKDISKLSATVEIADEDTEDTESPIAGVAMERMRGKSIKNLTKVAEAPQCPFSHDFREGAKEYTATLAYLQRFLAKPHESIGRTGPVCPFVPKSLQMDSIKLAVVRTCHLPESSLREELTRLLVDFLPQFRELEPRRGRQQQYKAVIFIFPDIATADAEYYIEGAQLDAKPEFVAQGLMVGEFHAGNNSCSLRNSGFFPLRTPTPCLAIRHMVPGDLVFMTLDNYGPELQRKFLTSFLDVFGEEDRAEVRTAKAQLAGLAL